MKKRFIIIFLCVLSIIITMIVTAQTSSISGSFGNIQADDSYNQETIDWLVQEDHFSSSSFKSDYFLHREDYKMYTVRLDIKNNRAYTLHWLKPSISHCPDGVFYLDDQLSFDFDYCLKPNERLNGEYFSFLLNISGLSEEEIQNIIRNLSIRISYQAFLPLNLNYSILRFKPE